MRHPTVQELQWLMGHHPPPCVSLYMPMHRAHPDSEQNPIRYKTLLRQVTNLLASVPKREAEALIARLQRIEEDAWRRPRNGLAAFCAGDTCVHYEFEAPVPEVVVVAETFHTKPFVRYLNRNRPFYVLVAALNGFTLWHGNRGGIAPVDVATLPANLRAALGSRELQPSSAHPGPAARAGRPVESAPLLDGESRRHEIEHSFRAIDRALWKHLRDERAPLVLAAVDSYHSIFGAVCRYPHLVEPGLVGNFEKTGADELHRAVWPLMAATFDREVDEAVDRFRDRQSSGRADDDLRAVAAAVVRGRVSELLVLHGRQVWGIVNRSTGELQLQERQEGASDSDVLDDLAEMTWMRGGRVLVAQPQRMPTGSPVAAIYRY